MTKTLTAVNVWLLAVALIFFIFRGDGTFGYGACAVGGALGISTITLIRRIFGGE